VRDLLTVEEAAGELRVHPQTIRRWIADGELPAHRPGPRTIRISRRDLNRFMANSAKRDESTESAEPEPAAAVAAGQTTAA
jgi:excisionase family DNA binding protein